MSVLLPAPVGPAIKHVDRSACLRTRSDARARSALTAHAWRPLRLEVLALALGHDSFGSRRTVRFSLAGVGRGARRRAGRSSPRCARGRSARPPRAEEHAALLPHGPGEQRADEGIEDIVGSHTRLLLVRRELERRSELVEHAREQYLAPRDGLVGAALVGVLRRTGPQVRQPPAQRRVGVGLRDAAGAVARQFRTVEDPRQVAEDHGAPHRAVGDPVGGDRQRQLAPLGVHEEVGGPALEALAFPSISDGHGSSRSCVARASTNGAGQPNGASIAVLTG